MTKKNDEFNWVSAVLILAESQSLEIGELARAAGLDPINGDLACADFAGLDLSNQNMQGWNLEYATWRQTNVEGANLLSAKVTPEGLVNSINWRSAKIDEKLRNKLEYISTKTNGTTIVNILIKFNKEKFSISNADAVKTINKMLQFMILRSDGNVNKCKVVSDYFNQISEYDPNVFNISVFTQELLTQQESSKLALEIEGKLIDCFPDNAVIEIKHNIRRVDRMDDFTVGRSVS